MLFFFTFIQKVCNEELQNYRIKKDGIDIELFNNSIKPHDIVNESAVPEDPIARKSLILEECISSWNSILIYKKDSDFQSLTEVKNLNEIIDFVSEELEAFC